MNSFNNYAYGAVGEWIASNVAGIDLDPGVPCYKRSILAPHPGGGITRAVAALKTAYGRPASSWTLHDGRFIWNVEVPPNTMLPPEAGGKRDELSSGLCRFEESWFGER